jgi:hypothetical protein
MPALTPTSNLPESKSIAGAPCPAPPPTTSTTTTTLPPALSGGPPVGTDCHGEWLVAGATGTKPVVRCKRGTASCDQGGSATACTLRAHLCFADAANALYRGRCAARPVTRFALAGRARDDADRAHASSVLQAVAALGGQAAGNTVNFTPSLAARACTGPITLSVPLRSRGGRQLSATKTLRTTTSAGKRDVDTLKVTCTP